MARNRRYRPIALFQTILLAALASGRPPLWAQLGPLSEPGQAPQAQSQKEFDAYLEIVTEKDPREIIGSVNAMAAQYPDSKLLGVAYQYQMAAFQRLGDFDGMLEAGKKALLANPGNLNTLLILAPAMANFAAHRQDRAQLLSQAEIYARDALAAIDKVRPPHQVSLETWEKQKRTMQSSVHETLGMIALNRGNPHAAIEDLEAATLLQPTPDGAQYFRLAMAYIAAGKNEDAKRTLTRAAELGPDAVRRLALSRLNGLSNEHAAPGANRKTSPP